MSRSYVLERQSLADPNDYTVIILSSHNSSGCCEQVRKVFQTWNKSCCLSIIGWEVELHQLRRQPRQDGVPVDTDDISRPCGLFTKLQVSGIQQSPYSLIRVRALLGSCILRKITSVYSTVPVESYCLWPRTGCEKACVSLSHIHWSTIIILNGPVLHRHDLHKPFVLSPADRLIFASSSWSLCR